MPFKLLFLTLFPYTTLFRSPRALRRTPGHGGRAAPRRTRRRRRCSTRRIRTVRSGHRRDRQAQATAIGVVEHTSTRSEEHTSELQSRGHLVCRLLLEKKKRY